MPKDPDKINANTRLALFLIHIKLKQLDLAKEINVATSNVARYASGITPTPQKVVDHLYKKYNLNLHWWYTGKGSKIKDTAEPKSLISDIGLLADKIEMLTSRIDEQDRIIKKLVRDVYNRDRK